jgi:hypothetical protein
MGDEDGMEGDGAAARKGLDWEAAMEGSRGCQGGA